MAISLGLLVAASILFSLMPARAQTIYPTQRWCRVYDDTAYIQIPGQCGTVVRYYPRKLFVRSWRQPSCAYSPY
jgi:hypothetical protein